MKSDGSDQTRLTATEAFENNPAWSPDGARIAFEADGIHVMDADGSNALKLTDADEGYGGPVWSPSGDHIAFEGYREGSDGSLVSRIFVANDEGSGVIQLPEGSLGDVHYGAPAWSPADDQIAFVSNRDGGLDVYTMATDGTRLRRLTSSFNGPPSWSPDGTSIATFRTKAPRDPIALLYLLHPDDGSETQVSTIEGAAAKLSWQPRK